MSVETLKRFGGYFTSEILPSAAGTVLGIGTLFGAETAYKKIRGWLSNRESKSDDS